MKPIFSRTLETTLKKISIVLVVLAGLGCGFIAVDNFNREVAVAFENLLNNITSFQHVAVFMVLNGVILAILTISTGTGLIATEVHEGTFKLLSAKPNSRSQILISKLAGAFVGLTILMVLQLLAYYAYIVAFSGFDGNIIAEMVSYLPGYLVYGVVVILIFLAISTFVGTIAKKKVAALLPLLAVVIIVFGVIPFYRIIGQLGGTGSGQLPVFADINYQLASIFKNCISYRGKIAGGEMISYLTNLFKTVSLDKDIVRQPYGTRVLLENNDLKGMFVMMAYCVVSIFLYAGSFVVLKKKDI